MLWENIWIGSHLFFAGLGITLLNFYDTRRNRNATTSKDQTEITGTFHFLLIILIQFSFGGLFSAFMVFYFRSATLATSWPFLLLLAVVFAFNELFKNHYIRLTFQISVFFIALFSFAIYSVPVLVHRIGDDIFILSGVLSLVVISLFVFFIKITTREKFKESRTPLIYSIIGIFITINVLYFTNLIPPIPISLKESGVYHALAKNADGNYDVQYESQTLVQKVTDFFDLYQTHHQVPGEPVYVYSAIFSPTKLNVNIQHQWQYYSASKKDWITVENINLPIVGGRDGGYRTYSSRSSFTKGHWRVNIKTTRGQLIGRIKFDIKNVEVNVPFTTETKI